MFCKRFSIQTLTLVFYNALFCWVGFYAYAQADDYGFANMLKVGFLDAQKIWYMTWTGRCVNTFLISLACSFDLIRSYPFLLFINVLLNITAFYTLLTAIVERMSASKKFLMALLFQAIWFSLVSNLNENFYWLSGMPYTWTATLSLLVMAGLIHILRERNKGIPLIFLLLILVLLNGMILEQTCLAQMGILFLLTLYYIWRGKLRSAWIVGAAFIAATAAFLIMYFAPGTAVRMGGGFGKLSKHLFQALPVAAVFGSVTSLKFFTKPIVYLTILYIPAIVKVIPPFDAKVTALLRVKYIILLVILVAASNHAIHGFVSATPLSPRGEGLAMWMMAVTWVFLWIFGYRNEKLFAKIEKLRIYPWRNLILILCLIISPNFIALVRDIRITPLYAQEMKERYASTERQKSEGKKEIFLPTLKYKPVPVFYRDLTLSPRSDQNESYGEYWGVNAVTVYPRALAFNGEDFASLQDVIEKLKIAAGDGDPEVLFKLGELYDSLFPFPAMNGFSKNNALAAQYYLQAARQNYTPAQRRLIRVYATEAGVPRDYFRALGWLLRSQL